MLPANPVGSLTFLSSGIPSDPDPLFRIEMSVMADEAATLANFGDAPAL